jgi:hypothetical protein
MEKTAEGKLNQTEANETCYAEFEIPLETLYQKNWVINFKILNL